MVTLIFHTRTATITLPRCYRSVIERLIDSGKWQIVRLP